MSQIKEHRHLLSHPTITSFLWMKWRKMRPYFYTNVVFYLLFNRNDIGENVDISPAVREFCLSTECLKRALMVYFGAQGDTGGEWCCSNCDS